MTFNIDLILNGINTGIFWFGTIVASASIIVKATPTQKDDTVLAKIVTVLDYLSIFNAKIQNKTND